MGFAEVTLGQLNSINRRASQHLRVAFCGLIITLALSVSAVSRDLLEVLGV